MTMMRKAERKKAKLRLGISAPAGAGKTLGALLLAYGILKEAHPDWQDCAIWDKVCLIDTEEGSGELYVGLHKHGITIGVFNYIRISAPFEIKKYLDAMHEAERAGIEVIIEDSISHAWNAAGGILDKQGKFADATKNSYTAWRFVTPEHNAFVDAMLQSPAHIIATMRSKTEYVLETNSQGKQAPRKVGMAPVQREGMEYEFTVVFDINFDSVARAIKDRTDLFSKVDGAGRLEKREFMIMPDTGAEIYRWLNTGAESLDTLCERLAGEIRAVQNGDQLRELYAESSDFMQLLRRENSSFAQAMGEVFDGRAVELGLV